MQRGALFMVACGLLALSASASMYGRTLPSAHIKSEIAKGAAIAQERAKLWENNPNRVQAAGLNWRYDYLRPVENQGNCGSCFAFAAVHTIQDYFRYCGTPHLSVQNGLNCAGSCNGGWISNVYASLAWPGLVLESCERYRAANGFCYYGYQICDNGYWSGAYLREKSTCSADYNQMMAWMNVGVTFTICFGLQHNFYLFGDYNTAVNEVYPPNYGDSSYLGGHCMEAVGYGTNPDGTLYWHVKNSWGTGWGNGGFFKLRRHPYSGFNIFGWALNTEYFGSGCRPYAAVCPNAPFEHKEDLQALSHEERQWRAKGQDVALGGDMGELNSTNITTHVQPGVFVPLSVDHPVVKEVAYFAVQVLLSTPVHSGGFGCMAPLPVFVDQNTSISGPSMEEAIVQQQLVQTSTSLTLYLATQAVVGGSKIRVLFTFSNSDPSCVTSATSVGNPSGTYDTTVYLTQGGEYIMEAVSPASPPPEEGINVPAVVGGSVAAFVVVAAVGAYVAFRYQRQRKNYSKLQETYKEVVRKVTILESGPAGATFREAALSKMLYDGADEETKKQAGPAVRLHEKAEGGTSSSPTAATSSV